MRVLVTGAAGFIGSHVTERLVERGHTVRGIDDLSTGRMANLAGIDIDLTVGSILEPDALGVAVAGVDAIVHLAARPSVPRSIADPVATHEANTVGTLRVLEAARRLDDAHVIVASSSSVYGSNPILPKREDLATLPLSPYAASKLATEQYTLAWQHSYGLAALAFRFFNVFGPRQLPGSAYAAVIPAFVDAALRGEPLVVHGDGTQSRDFTYVGTVATVIVEAIERRVACDTPVNLAFGGRVTLLELIEQIGATMRDQGIDRELRVDHTESRAGDVPHSQADTTLLLSLFADLGIVVDPVALDRGLAATVRWMGERRGSDR
jgi:UDP-glucose 4-epimerase